MLSLRRQILNLPNLLTMGRIAAIPLFVLLTFNGDPLSSFWAAALYALASLTDLLDGWLARKWGMVTVLGKLLDPLADKLIVMAAMVMLVRLGRLASILVIVLLARELIVTGLRSIAASEGVVMAAGQGGKWKTALQLAGLIALLVHYTYPIHFGLFTLVVNFNKVGTWLLWLALVASISSAISYFRDFVTVARGMGDGDEKDEKVA